jgi:hypothetical protein
MKHCRVKPGEFSPRDPHPRVLDVAFWKVQADREIGYGKEEIKSLLCIQTKTTFECLEW